MVVFDCVCVVVEHEAKRGAGRCMRPLNGSHAKGEGEGYAWIPTRTRCDLACHSGARSVIRARSGQPRCLIGFGTGPCFRRA